MKFQYYEAFYSTRAHTFCPGVKARELTQQRWREMVEARGTAQLICDYRSGNKEAKRKLKAVTWCGYSTNGMRKAENMKPTGLYMIDIDHCTKDAAFVCQEVTEKLKQVGEYDNLMLMHITPSGKGVRLIMECARDFDTLLEHMQNLDSKVNFSEWGDFDTATQDVSRLSFIPQADDIYFESDNLFNSDYEPKAIPNYEAAPTATANVTKKKAEQKPTERTSANDTSAATDKQTPSGPLTYHGHLLTAIVEKYVSILGTPEVGERHNFYNILVKNFRNICDNDPDALLAVLPDFGLGQDERESQCRSICRSNNTGRLPRDFFLFLVKNGFYDKVEEEQDEDLDDDSVSSETSSPLDDMPPLPPVFREIIATCPRDFAVPCINALLPIMGTITSYLRAVYPFDAREHSTEFFSIIYAPAGTGKGFVERFINLLHQNIALRDILSDKREEIYCKASIAKSANERGPENPRVTKRIMEAKNSETDFLEKQSANNGHHMFTFAAEMDQWRKGVKAAGGNKDDMIRIAWDNGMYGQSFKSANSFKGRVALYWNVLITGTRDQLDAYFKNVENGLVTRCGFSPIANQEFADPPQWKALSKKSLETIQKFIDRCDANEYTSPLNFDVAEVNEVPEEEFDKVVPWRFSFRPVQVVDLQWIMPTIKAWLKEQQLQAAKDSDMARDVFRRRVAVRGFRLALLCTACYVQVGKEQQKTICNFVKWWMSRDMEAIYNLYGEKYNETITEATVVSQQSLWNSLPAEFNADNVKTEKFKLKIKTPTKVIIYRWKKAGVIKASEKDGYYVKIK